MKICSKCNIEKSLDEFSKDSKGKQGVKSKCKQCIKEYDSLYKTANKDKIQQYYINNKERINHQSKEYYDNNKEILLKKHTQYGKDNPNVRRKAVAKYLKSNLEYYKTYRKNRYHSDPQFKLRVILGTRLNKALKTHAKSTSILNLIGCSISELKEYIEKQFTDVMFWENHGIYWEVDHILPCDSFDLTDIEQQKQCFHYSNLQPLFKTDNRIKSNKIL
jgi:hypothetical protein